ncbi:hypothetical protein GE09DRAFT_584561 [Coniochaeta sp. 2T2.1]|nr:hypothetical protein GE09DRAFT_584561 [Coniochaeta sp. 2T2.1]
MPGSTLSDISRRTLLTFTDELNRYSPCATCRRRVELAKLYPFWRVGWTRTTQLHYKFSHQPDGVTRVEAWPYAGPKQCLRPLHSSVLIAAFCRLDTIKCWRETAWCMPPQLKVFHTIQHPRQQPLSRLRYTPMTPPAGCMVNQPNCWSIAGYTMADVLLHSAVGDAAICRLQALARAPHRLLKRNKYWIDPAIWNGLSTLNISGVGIAVRLSTRAMGHKPCFRPSAL